jgi:hypothetical protein
LKHCRRLLVAPVALAALALSACRRTTEDWVADLTAPDEWHRRMAALALRSVPDQDTEQAFRMVLRRKRERSHAVVDALLETLRVLGDRRPDLVRLALASLAPERRTERALLAEILVEQLRRGDEAARPVLEAFAEAESACGESDREAAAARLRETLAGLPPAPDQGPR